MTGEHDDFIRAPFDDRFVVAAAHREPSARERIRATRRPLPPPSKRARRRELRHIATGRHRASIRRRLAAARPWLIFGAITLGLVLVQLPDAGVERGRGVTGGQPFAFGITSSADLPRPERAPSRTPMGKPQVHPDVPGGYAFLNIGRGGAPVTYDPCRPIRYVVNNRTAPPEGDALITEAIATVSLITGLQFEHQGATGEEPAELREPYQRDRYGERWAPVLVAWSDPSALPALAGSIAGIGGSAALTVPGGNAEVYVSGLVGLDGPQLTELMRRPQGAAAARGVILHELGHLLGLDHVADPGQLMHGEGTQPTLQPGDLAGLSRLGTGPCFRSL